MAERQRFLVVSCDGLAPAVLGYHDHQPVAVMEKGVVVARTTAATAVPLGVSSPRARAILPEVTLVARDRWREERAKVEIVRLLEQVSPTFRICGETLAAPLRAMLRYFGSEEAVREATEGVLVPVRARWPSMAFAVTVADSLFAAEVFEKNGRISGETRESMAKLPVEVVFPDKMAQLCRRVGLTTVGSVTSLTAAAVSARFGEEGLSQYRLARFEDDLPFEGLAVEMPVRVDREVQDGEGVEGVIFSLARELEDSLAPFLRRGLRAQEGEVELRDLEGRTTKRQLSQVEGLTVREMLAVVRAMYEAMREKEAGLWRIVITVGKWQAEQGSQLSFEGLEIRHAHIVRALDRVVALVGEDHVRVAHPRGGRSVGEEVAWEPWGGKWPVTATKSEDLPWPGHFPVAPALVYDTPLVVEMRGATGEMITLEPPGVVMESPAALRWGGQSVRVHEIRGPWPISERWWEGRSRRCAIILVRVEGEVLHLLRYQQGRWWLDASFD